MSDPGFLPGRGRRAMPVLVGAALALTALSSLGLMVLASRAVDAEEARSRLRAQDRLAGAAREISARLDGRLREAATSLDGPLEDLPDLVGEYFLVTPGGKVLLPHLLSHPAADPPDESEANAVASFLRKAREEAAASADPAAGLLFVEEAIVLYPHPDLAGVLAFETARIYREAGNAERERFFLERLVDDIPIARDLSGEPVAPRAYLDLLANLRASGDVASLAERAIEFAEALADHAWGSSPLARDSLLARVQALLSPEPLPDSVLDRASFVDALHARLIPEATTRLPDRRPGHWSHVVVEGPAGTEVFGWCALEREGAPHIYGYRVDRAALHRALTEEATRLADLLGARVEIGLSPAVAAGPTAAGDALRHEAALGGELGSVPLRILLPPPTGTKRLKVILVGMSALLAAALVTGVLLAHRAVRKEWGAARLRQDFIDNVSHELRTPLTSIRMYAEMLEEEAELPDETRGRYLGWILSESERLSRLVEDVLDLGRLSRGDPALSVSRIRPAEIAEGVRALWAPPAEQSGFTLRVDVPEDLPRVRADPDAAHRALANLVGNAMRYSGDSREVGIEGRVHADRVHLTVWDRGPGIPEEARERLFTRFYRAPRDARREKGVGLGLVLAREIVRAGGGDVFLDSTSREGSRFTLALPVTEEAS